MLWTQNKVSRSKPWDSVTSSFSQFAHRGCFMRTRRRSLSLLIFFSLFLCVSFMKSPWALFSQRLFREGRCRATLNVPRAHTHVRQKAFLLVLTISRVLTNHLCLTFTKLLLLNTRGTARLALSLIFLPLTAVICFVPAVIKQSRHDAADVSSALCSRGYF